jgi:hypothetical protein
MGFGGRGRAGAGFGSRFSGLGFGSTDKEVLSEERELLKQRMEQIDRELED